MKKEQDLRHIVFATKLHAMVCELRQFCPKQAIVLKLLTQGFTNPSSQSSKSNYVVVRRKIKDDKWCNA